MSDKLSERLQMTPQLQMAIRMLSMTQDELFRMVEDWRQAHPGAIRDLAPGDPEPITEEEQEQVDQGLPVWGFLAEPPLPAASPRPDVWVFGNPPEARANPAATPRVIAIFDDETISRSAADVREASWLARSLRQRAKTMEKVVAAILQKQPQAAIALEPDKLPPIPVLDLAEAIGFHESTVGRVAPNLRYQTIHGVVQLTIAKNAIVQRALW
jgi:DNA-directed RNA polymerase specialized sigma54-like protein